MVLRPEIIRSQHSMSDSFGVSSSVRQGGDNPHIILNLFGQSARRSKSQGCFWDHHFVGSLAYADDLVLLAPSASSLRLMLKTCTDFAYENGLH